MVAIKNITKLTFIASSIWEHDYAVFPAAVAIELVELVKVLIFLAHASTGISAVEKKVYIINTTIEIITKVQPVNYVAVHNLFVIVASSSVS